jgi:lipid-A-disaccharide synthase-like uncharacterized protein
MTTPQTWLMVGFLGQALFTARFLAQWLVSERKKDSVIPVAFWWLSLAGGLTLLSYATYRQDPVIIVGQALGVFVYVRNLMLVDKGKRRAAKHKRRQALADGHVEPRVWAVSGTRPSNSSTA